MMNFLVLTLGITVGVTLSTVLLTVLTFVLFSNATIMEKLFKWYMKMLEKSIENAEKVFDKGLDA